LPELPMKFRVLNQIWTFGSCFYLKKVVFVKFSKKKFGIRVGVVVEKQKVNERGASSMFPPESGVWGQRPQFARLLSRIF
jgi:hypothetical protein